MAREYLGQVREIGGATRLYKAAAAFEIDEFEGTSGLRRRIFFEDISLVTYHREVGTFFVLAVGSLCAVSLFVILSTLVGGLQRPGTWSVMEAGIMATATAPIFILFLNRVIRKKDVITIFGRHGRARVEFEWRKAKARKVFQEICKAARDSRPAVRRLRPQTPQEPLSSLDLGAEAERGPDPSIA